MAEPMQARIAAALRQVVNPRTGVDVASAEMVRDVGVTLDGKVRFTLLLAAQDPASLVREVRRAVEQVEGVTDVRVDVKDPSQVRGAAAERPEPPAPPAPGAPKRSLPVMGQEPASRRAAVPPAPTPVAYPNLGRIIAIASGKGGVGKSTVATNIAVALARSGARVGLMDADIYGPNIPRMMGVDEPPPVVDNRIEPLEAYGVKVMSLGFLVERRHRGRHRLGVDGLELQRQQRGLHQHRWRVRLGWNLELERRVVVERRHHRHHAHAGERLRSGDGRGPHRGLERDDYLPDGRCAGAVQPGVHQDLGKCHGDVLGWVQPSPAAARWNGQSHHGDQHGYERAVHVRECRLVRLPLPVPPLGDARGRLRAVGACSQRPASGDVVRSRGSNWG